METLLYKLEKNKEYLRYVIEIIEYLEKNPDGYNNIEIQEKYDKILENFSDLSEFILKFLFEFQQSLIEIIEVFPEIKKYMTSDEIKKIEEEIDSFAEMIDFFNEFIKTNSNNIEGHKIIFLYMSIKSLLSEFVLFGNIFTIYDKYFDKLPLEKMPKIFSDSKQGEEYNIVDDLLFIDDLDN